MYSKAWVWLVSPAILLPLAGLGEVASYQKEIESFRVERETNLKKDGSWLTVAGLYWLREGESTVGADPVNSFRMGLSRSRRTPSPSGSSRCGSTRADRGSPSVFAISTVPSGRSSRGSSGFPSIPRIASLRNSLLTRSRKTSRS